MELWTRRFSRFLAVMILAAGLTIMSIVIYRIAYDFGLSQASSGSVQTPPQDPIIEYDNKVEALHASQLPELPLYTPDSP